MALSRGVKIVLGCVVALVLVVGGIGVAIFGAAWWGIGKAKQAAQQFEADQKRTDQALERANANAFTAPDDGVIAEDRLLRFLAVRKRLHDEVYLKHKDMLEAQAKKKDADLSALARLPGIMLELRAARAEALADQQMSEDEFRWLFGAVYRNLVIAGVARDGDGTSVSEATRSAGQAFAEQAEKAAEAAEANPDVTSEMKRQLREAATKAREQAAVAAESTQGLDVPPANMELFKKHRDEILKYTMGGLELLPI